MPITIPRKVVPITQAKPAPAAPQGLTDDQVRAMLIEQANAFALQLEAVKGAFSAALSAMQAQPKDKPAAGWDFRVEYRQNGAIETIRATPRKTKD